MTNRNRKAVAAILVLGLAAALAACGSAPRTYHYTLSYSPPAGGAAAPLKSQVAVAAPSATHLLRQDRIVYFTAANQLNFYQYHRWAETPPTMVQGMLIRQLRGAGLFENVVPYRAQKGVDYILRGRLLAMEEVDSATDVSVRFGLELELVRQDTAAVLWSGQHSCTRAVEATGKSKTRSVDEVVAALSGCAQESLGELTRSLRGALAEMETAAVTK